jgi:hypothetical protein
VGSGFGVDSHLILTSGIGRLDNRKVKDVLGGKDECSFTLARLGDS